MIFLLGTEKNKTKLVWRGRIVLVIWGRVHLHCVANAQYFEELFQFFGLCFFFEKMMSDLNWLN